MTGATIAFSRGAMARASSRGAIISVPLGPQPCASTVPNGSKTVAIFSGTHSANSCQLMRSISRVDGPELFLAAFFLIEVLLINTVLQPGARPNYFLFFGSTLR